MLEELRMAPCCVIAGREENAVSDTGWQWSGLIFAILLALHVISVWGVRFFPSQDGPAHLYNASVIVQYHRPEAIILRDYFVLHCGPQSNRGGHLLLAALLTFLPPLAAEKVLLGLYTLLFGLGFRFALESIRRGSGYLAIMSLPFVFSFPLHQGFYNFCLGLAVFFFAFGWWCRCRGELTLWGALVFSGLCLAVYVFHQVPLVMLYIAVGVTSLWFSGLLLKDADNGGRSLWRRIKACAAWSVRPLAALGPSVVLLALYLGGHTGGEVEYRTFLRNVRDMLCLGSLVSYSSWEGVLSSAMAVLFFWLVAGKLRRRGFDSWRCLLGVAVIFTLVYFLVPDCLAGASCVSARLNLFPFLILILWLGSGDRTVIERRLTVCAASCIALGFLLLHQMKYRQLNSTLEELVSCHACLKPGSTLLPLIYSRRPGPGEVSLRVMALKQASGYIASLVPDVVDLKDYEAAVDYFPVMFRPRVDPNIHLGCLETRVPLVDIPAFNRNTPGRVDYILVCRLCPAEECEVAERWVLGPLDREYETIFRSRPLGLAVLYRLKSDLKTDRPASEHPDCSSQFKSLTENIDTGPSMTQLSEDARSGQLNRSR
ncbi:hypothetical protein LLH00_16065 [bacterium]|nr:hypothetical protein [bacterium]